MSKPIRTVKKAAGKTTVSRATLRAAVRAAASQVSATESHPSSKPAVAQSGSFSKLSSKPAAARQTTASKAPTTKLVGHLAAIHQPSVLRAMSDLGSSPASQITRKK